MQPPRPLPHHPASHSIWHNIWHWLAHTVHWGDAPTWSAAVGGAVAVVYAVRGFRIQRAQLADQRADLAKLEKKQALTDRLLAYQAHAYARSLITGVETHWEEVGHPGRRLVRLTNESQATITALELHATLGGIECMILDPVRELTTTNFNAGHMPGWGCVQEYSAADSFSAVRPGTGRDWTVHADNAPADAQLKFTLKIADEVNGRWTIDENGRTVPDDADPEAVKVVSPRQP